MKNFPAKVLEDTIIDGENMRGKTFWISRACTVAMFIFTKYCGEWYVLANQRGEGCPDYVGYWNCPCGYVDFNETIREAAVRELYEESGISNDNSAYNLELRFVNINDDPAEGKQNITFRYIGKVTETFKLPTLTSKYSEQKEIEAQKWIPLKEVGKYDWAFGHDKLIFEIFKTL